MRLPFILLLAVIFAITLTGCEQTQAEKNFWDGTEKFGKHVLRELLKDD